MDKEFPCSADTVHGHYDPFEVDSSIGPFPGIGSTDEYQTGDLSGKYGLIDNVERVHKNVLDSNLPVLGVNSVVGRSIVFFKKDNYQWACGTINPVLGKKDREISAIASFDDPRHLVHGYVMFKQIEYYDGSLSDVSIEVSLKHRDKNKKVTYGHSWQIYVNPVGADAYNGVDSVRCLAGGYIWNPYLAKMDDVYKKVCNVRQPLQCALGDLSGRLGPLSIGGDRGVYSDSVLPFTGNYSVLNRALVIFRNNNTQTPLACTNIKLNKHLTSNVVIQKNPNFSVAKFMQHMREQISTSEWLVAAEVQKTKEIKNNECVQILVHFYGKFVCFPYGFRLVNTLLLQAMTLGNFNPNSTI